MSEKITDPIKVQSKHGEYSIELQGNLIRLDGKGVVTKALFQLYHEDVKKARFAFRWAALGFFNIC